MSTARRLSNDDVKNIFDCVHNNREPPQRLAFQIVVVGQNGMKLSPPSFEFEDGLYVLLKPVKKVKGGKRESLQLQDDPRVPPKLKSLVFKENLKETCPWSLSGPQFPTPTAIQQRYCYPKGDAEYSAIKGGALWTTYKENGMEDLDWRILHVYYSAKRAGNKSASKSAPPFSTSKKMRLTKPMPVTNPVTMPSLSTPGRQEYNSFCASFDDSPLSFDMPVSPFKDASLVNLVSLLTKTASVDTESDPVISPDRGFFDVQTEYEKANGITRQAERPEDKPNSSNMPPSHHRHYPSQWYPHWPMYRHPAHYPSYPADSNERPAGNWAYAPPPAASLPTQEVRKPTSSDTVANFVNELKAAHHQLRESVLKAGKCGYGCKRLLADWGRRIATDPMADLPVPITCERQEGELNKSGDFKTESGYNQFESV